MTRPADRLTGRAAAAQSGFTVRPFGMSEGEAKAIAAASGSQIPGTTGTNTGVSGTTGGAGERANLTTSTWSSNFQTANKL